MVNLATRSKIYIYIYIYKDVAQQITCYCNMLVVQQVGCEQQNQNFQRETPHLELNAGHMVANSLENV